MHGMDRRGVARQGMGPMLLRCPDCRLPPNRNRLWTSGELAGGTIARDAGAVCCAGVAAWTFEKGDAKWLRT